MSILERSRTARRYGSLSVSVESGHPPFAFVGEGQFERLGHSILDNIRGLLQVGIASPVIRGRGPAGGAGGPPLKWMDFYTEALSRFATVPGLKLEVSFEVPSEGAVTSAKEEETKTALREGVSMRTLGRSSYGHQQGSTIGDPSL